MEEQSASPPPPKVSGRLAGFLVRGRWFLLPASLLLFLIAWPVSQRLSFDRSIESLYAPDDPYLKDYLESKALFGGDELAMIAYTDPNLLDKDSRRLTPEAEQRILALAEELSAIEGVRARSTQDLANVSRGLPTYVVHSLTRGILLGQDNHTTAVVVRLEPQAIAEIPRGETIARIREVAGEFTEKHGFPTYVVGEPVQVEETFRYVEEDGRVLFYLSLALLGLVLIVLFRSVRWVLLPLLIVLVTIRWTEALLVASGVKLSMVSSMLNSLVTIVGVATVTHLAVHYREFRRDHDRVMSVRFTLSRLLPAIFWTCATTAVGFVSLLSSHVTPVRSFGLMMSLATALVFLAVTGIFPGGALIGRWSADPRGAPAEKRLVGALIKITQGVRRYPTLLAVTFSGIVVFSAAGFWRLTVETDFSKNFRESSPIVQGLKFVEQPEHFGGAGSWEVNFPAPPELTQDYLDDVEVLAERLRKRFVREGQRGEITKVLSITDATERIPRILMRTLELRLGLLNRLQPEFVPSLYNPSQGRMRIVLRARERQPAERKLELIREVERVSQNWADERLADDFPEADVKVTGLFVLLAHLIQSLLSDQLVSFAIAAAGIGGMMIYAFRSVRIGLIALFPNLFPIVFVIGGMGWAGVPINIATAMIASVSMGLTVDSSIHYISGYLRARESGQSVDEALEQTHGDVGRALIFANVALIVGFSVLTLSNFIPLVYFGILVSVAMLGGLAGNLLMLPLLLRWTSGSETKRQEPEVKGPRSEAGEIAGQRAEVREEHDI